MSPRCGCRTTTLAVIGRTRGTNGSAGFETFSAPLRTRPICLKNIALTAIAGTGRTRWRLDLRISSKRECDALIYYHVPAARGARGHGAVSEIAFDRVGQ